MQQIVQLWNVISGVTTGVHMPTLPYLVLGGSCDLQRFKECLGYSVGVELADSPINSAFVSCRLCLYIQLLPRPHLGSVLGFWGTSIPRSPVPTQARREPQQGPGNHYHGALSQPHCPCTQIESEATWGGVSSHHPTTGLEDCHKLPQQDPWWSPGRKWILCIFRVRKKPSGTPLSVLLSDGGAPGKANPICTTCLCYWLWRCTMKLSLSCHICVSHCSAIFGCTHEYVPSNAMCLTQHMCLTWALCLDSGDLHSQIPCANPGSSRATAGPGKPFSWGPVTTSLPMHPDREWGNVGRLD